MERPRDGGGGCVKLEGHRPSPDLAWQIIQKQYVLFYRDLRLLQVRRKTHNTVAITKNIYNCLEMGEGGGGCAFMIQPYYCRR